MLQVTPLLPCFIYVGQCGVSRNTAVQVAADYWLAREKNVPPKYRDKVPAPLKQDLS